MYSVVETRKGEVLILNKIIKDIDELLTLVAPSVQKQTSEDSLLCWVVDIFSEDFEEEYGSYDYETLEKLAVAVLNSKYYLIDDCEAFCDEINPDLQSFQVGFDNAFHPQCCGHWYDQQEFIILENVYGKSA